MLVEMKILCNGNGLVIVVNCVEMIVQASSTV